ncbi:MAG: anthranilate/aminodeoxychorismate synthase component II [Deltaproteobacteria bacterium]|nr:MAG: anthranilate/aminodeoxychorismate synthase component II [Deltaproteobacteria bacterium]
MRVLVIDNYDSFTYNLVHLLGTLGVGIKVVRNDHPLLRMDLADFGAILISPGPSRPERAGLTLDVIRCHRDIPILGVCLGHQAIARAFGAKIERAKRILHGKTSPIYHKQEGIFQGIPSPFVACRYHSLIVRDLPEDLEVTALDEKGEIMAIAHRSHPLFGVQFHPEAYLTQWGKEILSNFLLIAQGVKR